MVGQANVGDGTGDTALWAGIFRLTGTGFEVVGEDTWRVEASPDRPRPAPSRPSPMAASWSAASSRGRWTASRAAAPRRRWRPGHGEPAPRRRADRPGRGVAGPGRRAGAGGRRGGGHGPAGGHEPGRSRRLAPHRALRRGPVAVRPVSLALDADRIALAGWAGFSERRLWLVRADAALGDLQLWTPGALTASATARISTGFSNEGGLYLGSTLCTAAESTACLQAETAGPRPTVWYVDAAGAGLGAAASPECP
ncbi:MAG: hypothetical protein R3F43_13925 [bacterium]